MRKNLIGFVRLLFLPLCLVGCQADGQKTTSLAVVYFAAAVLSLLVLIIYCCITKKKDIHFLSLFVSVLVVNIGYVALAVSGNLEEALLANRIAYLGSVFLPLFMWMIILNVTNIRYSGWLLGILIGVGAIVFLIAASPGYLDIYYKEVTFEKINGVTVLNKVYGPLHIVYLVYLLSYFAAMIGTVIYAIVKKKIASTTYAVVLAFAVFINIGVWYIEQLVRIDFEILSLSYIISESFLLGLHLMMLENEKKKAQPMQQTAQPNVVSDAPAEEQKITEKPEEADPVWMEAFQNGVLELTTKERMIYDSYIAGMSTSQIMEQLNIKENTLKFHNKNIYSKLGVSSRKQLVERHRMLSGK